MRVESSVVVSFAYDDGKTEKGIGTLASKSRLPGIDESRLGCLPKCSGTNRKEARETLASGLVRKTVGKEKGWKADNAVFSRLYYRLMSQSISYPYPIDGIRDR